MIDVEKKQQSPRMFRSSVETEVDSQYLCQFTMLLMDTVEELAVKVSQIEFVCRQHFPDLQTLSQSIQKKILGFKKTEDLEWRKKEDHLLQQIEELQSERKHAQEQIKQLNASLEESWKKLSNNEQLLNRCQLEKKELLEQLMQKVNEDVKAKELEKDLQQQIKLKDEKIEEDLNKKKSLFEECNKLKTNYKNLKSQYNFLISRLGDGTANSRHSDMISEDENGTSTSCLNKRCNEDMRNNVQESALHASKLTKSKIDVAHQKEIVEPTKGSNSGSCTNISMKQGLIPSKPLLNVKKEASSGLKPSASRWRDTRSRQELKDGDPHDDFLNTPLENVRNLNMDLREVNENPISAPTSTDKDVDGDCSDEEILDLNSETLPEKCPISIVGASNKGFKYVEPVRRKADRENLKGIECEQCKKFYDAVLPDGGKAANTMRCEHHDGVSRHRYRFAPPLTPEGFWNIGFDSDL